MNRSKNYGTSSNRMAITPTGTGGDGDDTRARKSCLSTLFVGTLLTIGVMFWLGLYQFFDWLFHPYALPLTVLAILVVLLVIIVIASSVTNNH